VVEIDDGIATPEMMAQLIASHELARVFQQDGQDFYRLALQPDSNPILAQFRRPNLKLINAEADDLASPRMRHSRW
jgi:hypothetical protein